MADVRRAERGFRQAADCDHAAASGELTGEGEAGFDLLPGRPPVRGRHPGMRRDDVPAEDVGFEPELRERRADYRRGRLRRARTGELALGCERDAGDSRAAVACRLADEQEDRKSTRLNSSHGSISYAVFCLKKKKNKKIIASVEKPHRREHG